MPKRQPSRRSASAATGGARPTLRRAGAELSSPICQVERPGKICACGASAATRGLCKRGRGI
eukprot:247599-Prymnesium_polylepis.1